MSICLWELPDRWCPKDLKNAVVTIFAPREPIYLYYRIAITLSSKNTLGPHRDNLKIPAQPTPLTPPAEEAPFAPAGV
jgi:hypothetical protein